MCSTTAKELIMASNKLLEVDGLLGGWLVGVP